MLLQAKSLCVNLMTVLATVTVVKILSSKRVQRAIAAGEAVPKSLVTNLEQTLDACTQSSLPIPGELQGLALRAHQEADRVDVCLSQSDHPLF